MTKKPFLIITLLFTVSLGYAAPSKNTADYVRGFAPIHLNKKVSLDVAAVSPNHNIDHPKFGFLVASTFDTRNRVSGGKIIVVADKTESLDLIKRYGVKPDVERGRGRGAFDIDTLRLSGILRQTDNKVLFLDVASQEVPKDILKGLRDELADVKGKSKIVPAIKGKGKPPIKKGKPPVKKGKPQNNKPKKN